MVLREYIDIDILGDKSLQILIFKQIDKWPLGLNFCLWMGVSPSVKRPAQNLTGCLHDLLGIIQKVHGFSEMESQDDFPQTPPHPKWKATKPPSGFDPPPPT